MRMFETRVRFGRRSVCNKRDDDEELDRGRRQRAEIRMRSGSKGYWETPKSPRGQIVQTVAAASETSITSRTTPLHLPLPLHTMFRDTGREEGRKERPDWR